MASSSIILGAEPIRTNLPFKPDHSHQLKPELDPPGVFPEPMIIAPRLEHRQSLIILHGRGSFAARFGQPLLDIEDMEGKTLQRMFPHARIIFPTASRNRATIYKKSYTHQWFENWHLEEYTKRQELMSSGLQKSVSFIHKLLQQEIEAVSRENVVLWGLSQGCATSLISLLCWDGEPFAATIGMCGWLPYGTMIMDIAGEKGGKGKGPQEFEEDEEDDDPFARSDTEDEDDNAFGGSDNEEKLEQKDPGSSNRLFARRDSDG